MANSINRIVVDTLTATSHIKVDGYTIDLSANATTGQVLQYNGTSFVGASIASAVSNSDGTLTISPTTGAVVASIALGHSNTWTGAQTFNTAAVIFGAGATATGSSSFDLSGSSGTQKTSTGVFTIGASSTTFTNGATHTGSVAFNGGITASGANANDFSGGSGTFLTSTGVNTFGGSSNSFTNAVTIAATTNQLTLGATAHKAIISSTAPAGASNTLTIPDTAGAATFAFINIAQTHTGIQTFSSQPVFSSHIQVDGYVIDISAGATSGQALAYNGTKFLATTISGAGTVTSVATDTTLTGGPITGSGTLGINLAHANTWSATQTFSSHIVVDGYTIDLSAGATTSQVLQYNGTKFLAATVSGGSGIGSTGNQLISIISGGTRSTGTSATPLVVHSMAFDPSVYTVSSTTKSIVFRAVVATGNTTVTGHVKLRDITTGQDITTFNITNQTTQAKSEQTLTTGTPGTNVIANSEKVYEVRIYVDSPTLVSDTIEFYSAEIRVINTVN